MRFISQSLQTPTPLPVKSEAKSGPKLVMRTEKDFEAVINDFSTFEAELDLLDKDLQLQLA